MNFVNKEVIILNRRKFPNGSYWYKYSEKIKEDVEPEEDVAPEKDINEIKEVLEKADERTLKEVYNEMVSTNKRKTGLRGLQSWLGSSE